MVLVGFDPEQRKQTPQNADSAVGFDALMLKNERNRRNTNRGVGQHSVSSKKIGTNLRYVDVKQVTNSTERTTTARDCRESLP